MDIYQQYLTKCIESYEPCKIGKCVNNTNGLCMQCGTCKECLTDMFRNSEYANRTYNCRPITLSYVIRYTNRYSSEIYTILSYYLKEQLNIQHYINVVSIGCGPATELIALEKLSEDINISYSYSGYDKNKIWSFCQSIIKNLPFKKGLFIDFYENELQTNSKSLSNTNLLILNYVTSDVYKHNKNSLPHFFTTLTNIFTAMPSNSFIIINDVNSYNMGRDEIEEWALNLSIPHYQIIKHGGVFNYPQRAYNAKFSQIDNNVLEHTKLLFSNPSIQGIDNFYDKIKECRSAFVILQKRQIL